MSPLVRRVHRRQPVEVHLLGHGHLHHRPRRCRCHRSRSDARLASRRPGRGARWRARPSDPRHSLPLRPLAVGRVAARETGAPTFAFGPHGTAEADSAVDADIEEGVTLEETTDLEFEPDVRVGDGEVGGRWATGWTMRGVHTPGHTSNHMCYALDEEHALFTGDHVMGWSTTVVSPPDGDMRDYIDSLRKVMARDDATLWPTHGAPVTAPRPFLQAFLDHRLQREAQVSFCPRSDVVDSVQTLPSRAGDSVVPSRDRIGPQFR